MQKLYDIKKILQLRKLNYDYASLSFHSMYQVSNQPSKNKTAIEHHIYEQKGNLFGLRKPYPV